MRHFGLDVLRPSLRVFLGFFAVFIGPLWRRGGGGDLFAKERGNSSMFMIVFVLFLFLFLSLAVQRSQFNASWRITLCKNYYKHLFVFYSTSPSICVRL